LRLLLNLKKRTAKLLQNKSTLSKL